MPALEKLSFGLDGHGKTNKKVNIGLGVCVVVSL